MTAAIFPLTGTLFDDSVVDVVLYLVKQVCVQQHFVTAGGFNTHSQ